MQVWTPTNTFPHRPLRHVVHHRYGPQCGLDSMLLQMQHATEVFWVVRLEIQNIVKRRDSFTSSLKFLEDDTRYSNLEQIGTKSHSRKMVLLLLWSKITVPLPPLWFHWSWCVVASSDIGNGTHFALIPLSHSLDAPQDPWLLFFLLPSTTN